MWKEEWAGAEGLQGIYATSRENRSQWVRLLADFGSRWRLKPAGGVGEHIL